MEKNGTKAVVLYCLKFLLLYCLLYYCTYAIIGLAAPGGYYSSFVEHYCNYPAWLRQAILKTSAFFLSLTGYDSHITQPYKVGIAGGRSVKIVYSCLGIAVFSFWIAFIAANAGSFKKKAFFILGGVLVIFLVNITRVVLLVIFANKIKGSWFEISHHTFFNIAAYLIVFLMIAIFARTDKNNDWFRKAT